MRHDDVRSRQEAPPGRRAPVTEAPLARFVAPARRRPQIWRLLVGLLLCGVIYFAVVWAVLWGLARWGPPGLGQGATLVTSQAPAATLLLLATFAGMAAGPVLAVRLLHRRSARSLLGPPARAARDFAVAAGIVLAVLLASLALWSVPFDAEPNLPPATWLALLPLTLAGLLVQTGAEELLFRGYLTQQLAARFRPWPVWLLLPALLFGVTHFDPLGAGSNAWLLVAAATVFGLIAADLTVRTGSLGAAWGFHFANNLVALGIVATDGTITGLALYVTPYRVEAMNPLMAAGDAAVIVLAWWLCRRALAR